MAKKNKSNQKSETKVQTQSDVKIQPKKETTEKGVLSRLTPAARFRLIGEITALLMSSGEYRKYRLQDIVRMMFPAIDLNQFRLYRSKQGPVGLVTWAFLTAEAKTAYLEGKAFPKFEDWNAGDQLVLMDFVVPYGHEQRVEAELRTQIFPDKTMTLLVADKEGKRRVVRVIEGEKVNKKSLHRGI